MDIVCNKSENNGHIISTIMRGKMTNFLLIKEGKT